MRTALARSMAWTSLVLAGACAVPITLPSEFVELRDAGDGFRAVTADDARLRVRDLADPTAGDLGFWIATLRNDLVQQRGYELVASGDVKDGAGQDGKWLQFAANVQGERVGFLVAVWLRRSFFGGPSLRVVEFAGREPAFGERLGAVRSALATTR
ncbi:MAG: hypothetical protein WAT39_13585 [Planctomycetota bacterium]